MTRILTGIRTIPPVVEILGVANASSNVTVNSQSVQRQDDLFFTQIPVDNSAAAVYLNNTIVGVRNNADASGNDAVQSSTVKKIVPKTPEAFSYDFDGNVLSDGRFNYTWDGENRLIRAESLASVSNADKRRIDFIYDGQSRRVSKKSYTWNGTAWALADSRRFLYDQFNLLAEVNDSGAVINSYAWGTDLSGSMYGAGGVGGLLICSSTSNNYPAFDANGNILGYVNQSGSVTAQFEYGPFGELIRSSGTPPCNFGFSTKYRDSETGLNYYIGRYYSALLARWFGKDPIEEQGGLNLYGFCANDGVNQWDYLGLDSIGPYGIIFDFAFGKGSSSHNFTKNDPWTNKMKEHVVVKEARTVAKEIAKSLCPGGGEDGKKIDYNLGSTSNFQRAIRLLADGIGFWQQGIVGTDPWFGVLGSFSGEWALKVDCSKCEGTIQYFLFNKMSYTSARRNPFTGYNSGSKQASPNPNGPDGPLRTISMTWDWEEKFDIPTGKEK